MMDHRPMRAWRAAAANAGRHMDWRDAARRKAFARFLALSGGHVFLGWVLYYGLFAAGLAPLIAYVAALAAGFLCHVLYLAPFVHGLAGTSERRLKSALVFGAYSAVYACAMAAALVLGVSPWIAPILLTAIGAPLQFLVGSIWLNAKKHE